MTDTKTDKVKLETRPETQEKPDAAPADDSDLRIHAILETLDRMEREAGYHSDPPYWKLRRRRRRVVMVLVAFAILGSVALTLA